MASDGLPSIRSAISLMAQDSPLRACSTNLSVIFLIASPRGISSASYCFRLRSRALRYSRFLRLAFLFPLGAGIRLLSFCHIDIIRPALDGISVPYGVPKIPTIR